MLLLKRFPLPPTSNHLYMPINGRLIKTTEARKYAAAVEMYKLREFRILDEFKANVKDKDVFDVSCHFSFCRDRVYSKKETLKKLDASNRIKQTHDGLSKILDIDDCRFVSGGFSKVYCKSQQDEQVIIVVRKTAMLSLDECLDLIRNGSCPK